MTMPTTVLATSPQMRAVRTLNPSGSIKWKGHFPEAVFGTFADSGVPGVLLAVCRAAHNKMG